MTTFTFNTATTSYDPNNAYWLGQAAKLAYSDEAAVRQMTTDWGFDQFQFFDHEGTQGFLVGNRAMAILAFWGTEPTKVKDWLSDADLDLVDFLGGKAHDGFVKALSQIWPEVQAKLAEFLVGGQPLWITGHSLGAALATLATARLRLEQNKPIAGLYNYGQPRVGNAALAKIMDDDFKRRYFRFVNNNDAVPRVPVPELLLRYTHAGTLLYFDENGSLQTNMPWYSKLWDGVKGRFSDLLKPGTDGIKDHSMDQYVECLKKNIGVVPKI
jgi:triacylglycerol lipase